MHRVYYTWVGGCVFVCACARSGGTLASNGPAMLTPTERTRGQSVSSLSMKGLGCGMRVGRLFQDTARHTITLNFLFRIREGQNVVLFTWSGSWWRHDCKHNRSNGIFSPIYRTCTCLGSTCTCNRFSHSFVPRSATASLGKYHSVVGERLEVGRLGEGKLKVEVRRLEEECRLGNGGVGSI